MTNEALAERMISSACPQRERAVQDLAKELSRRRCADHPTYKASMPPRGDCQPCWKVWRARGNPPPP